MTTIFIDQKTVLDSIAKYSRFSGALVFFSVNFESQQEADMMCHTSQSKINLSFLLINLPPKKSTKVR